MILKSRQFEKALSGTLFILLLCLAGITKAQTENILFDDANVKALCVANWDTDEDGELSYVEAAAVIDLGQVFFNNNSIASFDELQFFSGLLSINETAFCRSSLVSVVIPNSVISIEKDAFAGCSSLVSVVVPNSLTIIGEGAFVNCFSLPTITLPGSLNTIGELAFSSCRSLTSVIIPNAVTTIGDEAFRDCIGLTTVTIPSSVTQIGTNPFSECSGLEQIMVDVDNVNFDSRENCNALIESSSNVLLSGCKNSTIPGSVVSISDRAFAGCSGLTSVMIPSSVSYIGSCAFLGCRGLTSIIIPNTVFAIAENAFTACSGLEQITVEEGNSRYDSRENCNAIIQTSSNELITGCKNTIIPRSVTSIGEQAFGGCYGLTSIDIPGSVSSIGLDAFYGCSGLTTLVIPNTVTMLGSGAFGDCSSLATITLPNTVVSIASFTFSECSSLASITIPKTVTSIGSCAFLRCINLSSITILADLPPLLDDNVFSNVNKSIPVYVPAGTADAYRSALGWNEFTNFQELDGLNIQFVDANVKALCVANWDTNEDGELSYVEAAAVTNLGMVFYDNNNLMSFDELQYFVGLTSLPEMAFSGCSYLSSIAIPAYVEDIGDGAFFNCSNLFMMTVRADIPPTLGNDSFEGVPNRIKVLVPCGTSELYKSVQGWCNLSTIVERCRFISAGNWSIASNWEEGSVPGYYAEIYIDADCRLDIDVTVKDLTIENGNKLVINNGKVLSVTNTLINNGGSAHSLVIEKNGQLFHNNNGIFAIVQKSITSYSEGENDGWHLIASPLVHNIDVTSVESLTYGEYDLYYYDEPTHSWVNEEFAGSGFNLLEPGKGYLYANSISLGNQTQIGNGTNTSYKVPFNSFFNYSFTEQVFMASEIGNAGNITSISFYLGQNSMFEQTNEVTLFMKNVLRNAFADNTDYEVVTNDDIVYSGEWTIPSGYVGWLTIDLDTPFPYDGTSNLMVAMREHTSGYKKCDFAYTEMNNTVISYYSDSYTPDPYNLELYNGNKVVHSNRSNIQLSMAGLIFAGEVKRGNAAVYLPLNYTETAGALKGFNLVGNPYVHNVTSYASYNVANGCYLMNETQSDLIVSEISAIHPLKPTEGFFVKATGEDAFIFFNPGREEYVNQSGSIVLEVAEGGKLLDRLIVKAAYGQPLEKVSLNELRTKVYALRDGQDLSIVPYSGNEQAVYFKAARNGIYTISVAIEEVEVDYLHLIDNNTGADIDLLQTPSYTFNAKTTDYESRFCLLFDVKEASGDDDSPFAYVSDGEIILASNGIDAMGKSLQVIDVMGHIVKTVEGNAMNHISTAGITPGVYFLRLIDGDGVRVQTIIIK